ncbi:MAG: hypothetical protein JOS17DRAFT_378520 [Linnemannia elongata]|nr:MAG: hypothetical protein JOS17DRAFT_378520 [Linnemannia elongata]
MVLHSRKHLLFITTLFIGLLVNTNPATAQNQQRCVIETQNKYCDVLGDDVCPPCWVPQSDGYVCSYKRNGSCITGVWDRESELARLRGEGARREASRKSGSDRGHDESSASDRSSYDSGNSRNGEDRGREKTWCKPGNKDQVCKSKCPPCWLKQGTYYSCEYKYDGQCRLEEMETVYI